MLTHEKLREQIRDFQQFIVADLWSLSHVTEDAQDLWSFAQKNTAAITEEDIEIVDGPEEDEEGTSDL